MLLKFISHFYNGSDKDYKSLLWWKEVQSLFKLRIITIKVSLAKLNQCLPRICFPSQEKAIKWNMVEDTFVKFNECRECFKFEQLWLEIQSSSNLILFTCGIKATFNSCCSVYISFYLYVEIMLKCIWL